jgi:tRNA (guanine37-N1)-methyltransferase
MVGENLYPLQHLEVPEVLVSGNHKLIDLWKFRKALELTKERRPDLFKKFLEQDRKFTKEEAKIVEEIRKLEP